MAQFVLLSDYIDLRGTLTAGTVLDERHHDIAALRDAGAALVEKLPCFDRAITEFLTQRRRLPTVDFSAIAAALNLPGVGAPCGATVPDLVATDEDYYEGPRGLGALAGTFHTSVVLLRVRSMTLETGALVSDADPGEGFQWQLDASDAEHWAFSFACATDQGRQICAPTIFPRTAAVVARVLALGVRVDLERGQADFWVNGAPWGASSVAGKSLVPGSASMLWGRSRHASASRSASLCAFSATNRRLADVEMAAVLGEMLTSMDASSEGLAEPWEFSYSVRRSAWLGCGAPVMPNLGSVPGAELERRGTPRVREVAAQVASV